MVYCYQPGTVRGHEHLAAATNCAQKNAFLNANALKAITAHPYVKENPMSQTITAVYENGVLRPLTPLALLEHAQVELDVRPLINPADAAAQREQVRRVLADAGVLATPPPLPENLQLFSAQERAALAQALADSGVSPLSTAILDEREGH